MPAAVGRAGFEPRDGAESAKRVMVFAMARVMIEGLARARRRSRAWRPVEAHCRRGGFSA
jgi:hypothetical protein